VYLHPGGLVAPADPRVVTTILGSGVPVCLFDPRRGIGGANHYLLPHWAGASGASPRYGNTAIRQLIDRLVARGAVKADLRAKVFGGACVMEAFQGSAAHVGTRNASVALELLDAERITVLEEDLGGSRGRRLVFRTDDGSTHITLI